MNSTEISFEVRGALRQWLRRVKHYVTPCPGPFDWRFEIFDLPKAKERKHFVAPVLERFFPEHPKFMACLRNHRIKKMYLARLSLEKGDQEDFFSARADERSMAYIMSHALGHCLFLPRDESFLVLSTRDDYWLVSGSRPIVEEIIGMRLEQSFAEFRETLEGGNPYDPSDEFYSALLHLYEKHNLEVEKKK